MAGNQVPVENFTIQDGNNQLPVERHPMYLDSGVPASVLPTGAPEQFGFAAGHKLLPGMHNQSAGDAGGGGQTPTVAGERGGSEDGISGNVIRDKSGRVVEIRYPESKNTGESIIDPKTGDRVGFRSASGNVYRVGDEMKSPDDKPILGDDGKPIKIGDIIGQNGQVWGREGNSDRWRLLEGGPKAQINEKVEIGDNFARTGDTVSLADGSQFRVGKDGSVTITGRDGQSRTCDSLKGSHVAQVRETVERQGQGTNSVTITLDNGGRVTWRATSKEMEIVPPTRK